MSRNVDDSDLTVLSPEDLDYLESRGRVHIAKRVQEERKRRAGLDKGAEPVVEEVDLPYDKWKPEELKEELGLRGLSTEGKKGDLVKRLEDNDAQTQG